MGPSDIKEECVVVGQRMSARWQYNNEHGVDRYGCPAANCVAAVPQTGILIFEHFCCDSIKH